MDEFSLYIIVPGRKNRKAAEEKLTEILRKTKGAVLRLTWILEGRQAGFSGARRVIRFLKRQEKERGIRILINTMELRSRRKSLRLLMPVLSRYRFRIIFRFASLQEAEDISRLMKQMNRRGISTCYWDASASGEGWLSWLNRQEYLAAEPYLDYLKIFMGNRPLSCRYRSCLGRTLAIDGEGRPGICAYRENSIRIRDPSACETLDEVFETEEFLALLKKQVAVRDNCAAGCRYYRECKGGCPLSPEAPCPEPELLQALRSAADRGLPESGPAVREEKLERLARRFTV